MDKLERLEKEFNEANDKKTQLQRDVAECAARLERAKKLIGGLGGERTRWTESCATLELSYAKLVGDALISAATIAYTGAFTPTFRKGMTDHWQTRRARGVPSCGAFDLWPSHDAGGGFVFEFERVSHTQARRIISTAHGGL